MSIYVAQVGAHVKVGYSDNPERRVAHLLQGTVNRPYMLDRSAQRVLIGTVPEADKGDERMLQSALHEHHCLGEWFYAEAGLLEKVAAFKFMDSWLRWQPVADLVVMERIPEPSNGDPVVFAAVDLFQRNRRARSKAKT